MSRPFDQTQQSPPDFVLQQNTNTSHSPHGSIGAVVGVLIVVLLLGLVAAVIGRVCSGRSIFGYGHYDLGSWAEAKCASCIDGRINAQIPRPNVSATSSATANPAQTQEESELQPPQTANV
ncbi:hypothetical protein C1H46_041247 [Malus baccata]|uniref:Uncharacterized protein n=1 Tax=Malus baccata TaxID=106549 RepID=A0A540KGC5_MALBA|nr:hypothetical protein C1H46_041247 [Malus baccata]